MNVGKLIQLLQQLNLPESELRELTTSLATDGLTPKVKRRVRSILMELATEDTKTLDAYEQAIEVLSERDEKLRQLAKETKQKMNQGVIEANAKLDRLERRINEDKTAADSGATLLLNTDDVVVSEAKEVSTQSSKKPFEPVELSPKQAAATAIVASKVSSTVSPISAPLEPSSPSLPEIPKNQPLPVTVAPLPPTPIAPPAMPANAALSQPLAAAPAMTEPAAA